MENKQATKLDAQFHNKYQHKLIVAISTIDYINNKHKKYTQSNLLYYFNGNLKRNGHKETTLKTLQKYLYKLEKVFKVTINYHKHLGVNMGTEVHYKLKYSKKECHLIINKHFRDKKEERHKNRVNSYLKKRCNKKESVEKAECFNNTYNNKEEDKSNIESIEKLQVKKYAKKCNFKSNAFLSILNLEVDKNFKIQLLKAIKIAENSVYKKINRIKSNNSKLESKQKELSKILDETKANLENEGYDSKQLETQIQNVYEQYKNKPHFIIEKNKYSDLKNIIGKLKKSVERVKSNTKKDKRDIGNNIFSILIDQLRHKVRIEMFIPLLKEYLGKQGELEYGKVFNNQYYYDFLDLIKNDQEYLNDNEFKRVIN
ncbi:plasmid maintenance protein (plasmid) [Borrelia puertoricensis]|uniref:plasmid maintenance protein n=1 Tax=Borrelia puertoricensis TaxID=2756107 RepID=UPI003EBD97A3